MATALANPKQDANANKTPAKTRCPPNRIDHPPNRCSHSPIAIGNTQRKVPQKMTICNAVHANADRTGISTARNDAARSPPTPRIVAIANDKPDMLTIDAAATQPSPVRALTATQYNVGYQAAIATLQTAIRTQALLRWIAYTTRIDPITSNTLSGNKKLRNTSLGQSLG
jgi:hypothetical protein